MLEPREADLPILFLVLVVLPVVTYILLGKWSDCAKKKERVNLLAQLAAEEALRAEAMAAAAAVATVAAIPVVASPCYSSSSSLKNGFHECARCFSPATTRCSRCKSIRYCSGKCQILHWRQVHKEECRPLDNMSTNSDDSMDAQLFSYYGKDSLMDKLPQDSPWYPSMSSGAADTPQTPPPPLERNAKEKQKINREMLRKEEGLVSDISEETKSDSLASSCKEVPVKHKEMLRKSKARHSNGNAASTSDSQVENSVDQRNSDGNLFPSLQNESHAARLTPPDFIPDRGNMPEVGVSSTSGSAERDCGSWGSVQAKNRPHSFGISSSRTPKSSVGVSQEHGCVVAERREHNTVAEGSNGAAIVGIMKMMAIKKSGKVTRHDVGELNGERHNKKTKMLFPYEEFVKFFQYDAFDLSPRGLINCGNSCYANAVLQCMTCTKPLTIYLLHRSHSRACCVKDWCLMCELEQHVTMLREYGAPLSPGRILSHMRTINRQIGDGSQEDAHEFLRILIASMQSICLEGLGGEKKVDPRLQETTFIQHTFGGRLRSKVKCLRCHHESERYENIMDLTLEIYGWVESLEDALTQFTTPEDLDGENMYRCGRCAAYVRARKQLSIHEAPNILTIVLKRFQEGRYGKISKFITFPEMLDMIPYMTGAEDVPPPYMLYAVVVHLDTLNASFSGHYVSYVRNLHGSWFRIDDTEVQPVSMSQVMSEGAYILFYMRSSPRPPHKSNLGKTPKEPAIISSKHCTSKNQKASRHEQSRSTSRPSSNGILRVVENNNYVEKLGFSDAASSDWSLFTSSDDASFTTESTRDSFSTVDYADNNGDLISSIFSNPYTPHRSGNPVSCRLFSNGGTQTRFVSEEKGFVLDSYLSAQKQDSIRRGEKLKHSRNGADRTSVNLRL